MIASEPVMNLLALNSTPVSRCWKKSSCLTVSNTYHEKVLSLVSKHHGRSDTSSMARCRSRMF